jgi:hypothetical protein
MVEEDPSDHAAALAYISALPLEQVYKPLKTQLSCQLPIYGNFW